MQNSLKKTFIQVSIVPIIIIAFFALTDRTPIPRDTALSSKLILGAGYFVCLWMLFVLPITFARWELCRRIENEKRSLKIVFLIPALTFLVSLIASWVIVQINTFLWGITIDPSLFDGGHAPPNWFPFWMLTAFGAITFNVVVSVVMCSIQYTKNKSI